MLFVLLPNACKPDMVLVSIYVEQNLSESEFESESDGIDHIKWVSGIFGGIYV